MQVHCDTQNHLYIVQFKLFMLKFDLSKLCQIIEITLPVQIKMWFPVC